MTPSLRTTGHAVDDALLGGIRLGLGVDAAAVLGVALLVGIGLKGRLGRR